MIRRKTVRAPDGSTWTIRRRWAPRPQWRGRSWPWRSRRDGDPVPRRTWGHFLDYFPGELGDEFVGAILLIVGLVLFVVFMIFVGWPLLVFLVESLLIIPITFAAGVLGRVLFRRPWTIEAAGAGRLIEWKAVGWRRSSRAADRMAKAIAANGDVAGSPPEETPRAHRKAAR